MIFIIFVAALSISNNAFYLLMLFILTGMMFEWHVITKSNFFYWALGILLPIPIICLIFLKSYFAQSGLLIFWYFIIIWTNDTAAMIAGRNIGGPRLAPIISPNKTWSGFVLGVLTSSLIAIITNHLLKQLFNAPLFSKDIANSSVWLIALLIAIIAQLSDLSISLVKRRFKVKDSGNLIPGHGGVLDRFDSIIFTSPILLLISFLISSSTHF
ncbi:MAG: phosphatidate cytidylyltransferase [Rickettsiaceae bacterium]|nr:phosphatidate cytidylyltransferase [Rickettsiaceae bacterium]